MSLTWLRAVVAVSTEDWPHDEQGPFLYHGTTYSDDEGAPSHITPGGGKRSFQETDRGHAYATPHLEAAKWYAETLHEADPHLKTWSAPRILKVRPTGPVEDDPNFAETKGTRPEQGFLGDVRSEHPFEVHGEVSHPDWHGKEWHCGRCGYTDHWTDDHDEEHPGRSRTKIERRWDEQTDEDQRGMSR